jgi:poly(3-hydroxybutyrate) depolymerase
MAAWMFMVLAVALRHESIQDQAALTLKEASALAQQVVADRATTLREERKEEMEAKVLEVNGARMPFWFKIYGEKPEGGRSLWISLHGGGGTTTAVNDGQWNNQKRLYQPEEGVYLVPRAPTDTWNLWHRAHMDPLLDRLIENLVVFEDVNPDRVFLMGYSAGGDGVYQLAPRMADRWAAAAMMAGHPGDARTQPLRNLPFTLHVGGKDGAYQRNQRAEEWKERLAGLAEENPGDYPHWVRIPPDKGHWMDREDAAAVPWMAERRRNLRPERVTWVQDDVTHSRFYWLAVETPTKGAWLDVERRGQDFLVHKAEGLTDFILRLDDSMVDLDRDIRVFRDGKVLFQGRVPRTAASIRQTLAERGDPSGIFTAEVAISLRQEVLAMDFSSAESREAMIFSDPDAWQWNEVEGGSLGWSEGSRYSPPVRSPRTLGLVGDLEVRDFVLEAEVMQVGKEYAHRDICFFLHFTSPSRFTYVHLSTRPDARAHNVFLVADAARVPLLPVLDKGIEWGRDTWHRVKVDSSPSRGTVQVFFEDMITPLMEAPLKGDGWGRVGVGSFDDPGCIRSFRIRAAETRAPQNQDPFPAR